MNAAASSMASVGQRGGHAGCHGICKTSFVTCSYKNPSNAARLDWQPCATGTPRRACAAALGNYALQNRDTTSPTLRPLPTQRAQVEPLLCNSTNHCERARWLSSLGLLRTITRTTSCRDRLPSRWLFLSTIHGAIVVGFCR